MVTKQHWLEESEQRLEKVDRTHLALASGKPILQNNNNYQINLQRSTKAGLLDEVQVPGGRVSMVSVSRWDKDTRFATSN